MGLRVQAALAGRGFAVELDVADGEQVAVLGPNGSGKSTLLGILAGTLRPDHGRATLDDTVLFDLDARPHRWRPPHARGVALLAQEALLFPHLSVLDNVAFGPRVAGRSRSESRAMAERWLDEVDAIEFAGRRPGQLSGGQAQRVAIARALAAEPRLLLLDEPMAALDISVAPLLRRVLRRVLAGRTTMIVTHDLMDALLLSERMIVLEKGGVVEAGPTAAVLQHPRARFTAHIAGLNLVTGVLDHGAVRDPSGALLSGAGRRSVLAGRCLDPRRTARRQPTQRLGRDRHRARAERRPDPGAGRRPPRPRPGGRRDSAVGGRTRPLPGTRGHLRRQGGCGDDLPDLGTGLPAYGLGTRH